jgi:predicted nucleotidyltransferase
VLLKLVAYDGRPEKRLKDARDIANIIENYFDLQTDLVYDQHNDIFNVAEDALNQLFLEEVSAEVLGREIKKIIKDNSNSSMFIICGWTGKPFGPARLYRGLI